MPETQAGNGIKEGFICVQRIYNPEEGTWSLRSSGYPTVWVPHSLLHAPPPAV